MADHYRPQGPLDPLAEQICAFMAADPGWQALTETPPALMRAGMKAAAVMTGQPAMADVADHEVPVAGGAIAVRVYRPVARPRAILVWAHGGGFVLGSLDETDNFARALAAASGCTVVSVDYRMAPEHRFPTALEDMEAALRWAMARRAALAGDAAAAVFAGGDSAGGNLATVATRRLHAAGEGPIAGNLLAYPCVDRPDAPSLTRFEAPFLGIREISWFLGQYLPDAASGSDPDFAPILADNLHLLPPTFILTAEHDLITEQAEAYGARLASAGVPVQTARHAGMIHGFLTLDPFLPGAGAEGIRQFSGFVAAQL